MIINYIDIPIERELILELRDQYQKDVDLEFDLLPRNDKGEILTHINSFNRSQTRGDKLNQRYSTYRKKIHILHCLNCYLKESESQ